jgi:hypothetical protein
LEDEQIAVVEQNGRRFAAYLFDHPQIRAVGATQAEALDKLAAATREHLRKSQNTAARVQKVIIRTGHS